MRGLIQIAGIRDRNEAAGLLAAGVDLLGFPFRLPVHREDLPEEEAACLIRDLGIGGRSILITYLEQADEVAELTARLGCGWVQLHGAIAPGEVRRLKALRPELRLIQSLVIRDERLDPLVEEMRRVQDVVEAFLTDSHDPVSGADGATGLTHDWEMSRRLRETSIRPLILAGGLHAGNVASAIRQVRPAAVDAHTGVENGAGAKDPRRVAAFVAAAREAFQQEGLA